MSIEEAFEVPIRKKTLYTYKGQTGTLPYLCKYFGFSVTTIKNRIARGMALEQAFETPVQQYRKGPFTYKGVMKESLIDLCSHFNVSVGSIRNRLNSGMSLEKAFDESLNFTSNSSSTCINAYVDYNNKISIYVNNELEKTFLNLNKKINENLDYIVNRLKNGEGMENIMKDLN